MSILNKVVHILLTFIGRQIFLRVLAIGYLGINGLFANVLSMLSLADLGLATAMSYSFYKPLADKDEVKLAALIGFYKKIYNYIAAFVGIVGLILTPFLKYIINLENEIRYIEVYYLIALANVVISYLFVYKATIITADQHNSIIKKYSMWTTIAGMALQIVVLLTLKSYLIYCLVNVLGILTNNLLISGKADRMYPFIKKKAQLLNTDRKDIFVNIRSMFIYKLASVIYTSTDNILISIIVGTAIVGKYENYSLATVNLASIASIIFGTLAPSIGNLIVREKPEKRLRVFSVMQMVSLWTGGFFVYCLFFLLDDFVRLWLGADFTFDMFTKAIILSNFYLSISQNPIIAFRESTGIYRKTKNIMVGGAALNIALSIILGNYLGLAGIVLATIISKLLTYVWYEPRVLFRDYLGGSVAKYFFDHIVNIILLAACIALTYYFVPLSGSPGWLGWILRGAAYAIGINIVYILRYFRTPEFREIKDKSKDLLKRIR